MTKITKKLFKGSFLVLISMFINLSVNAATYYVDENGNDNTGNGSVSNPFASLSHAATVAIASGDIIHINTGNFVESNATNLAVGVSIEGEGVTKSIILSTVTASYEATISLISNVVNTNGNQHISGIAFNGNSITAWGAINIQARGNVHVYNCSFKDFFFTAVIFNGKVSAFDEVEPTVWTNGCSFYNNTVTNCSQEQTGEWMSGSLHIGALDGMEIYNNTFTETARGPGNCGYPIKYYNAGFNRNLKIHDNAIYKLPSTTNWNDWNFAIELWNYRGAVEIYNNHIEGSIDIDHVKKGIYSYALKIHDNYFGYPSLPPSSGDWTNLSAGLYIEFGCEDIYIYNNEFNNLETPIRFSPRDELIDGVHISYNIMNEIGNTSGDAGCNLMNFAGDNYTINNLNFVNNTVYAGGNGAQYGIIIPAERFTNTTIRNNIIQGFAVNPIEVNGTNINSLSIENNIFYANGTNAANIIGTPANYVNRNNLVVNPKFMSVGFDWALQTTSTARNAGLDVGFVTDINGYSIIGLPDIGACEYQDPDSTANNIVQFVLAKQTGNAVINATNHTVSIEVLPATDVTALTPTLVLSAGATSNPVSGVVRNFSSGVTYTVTALNGSTQNWTVNVTVAACPTITASGTVTNATDGASNGGVAISVSGGLSPYTYLWSNGTKNKNLSGVAAGNYSVTVTDAQGCTGNKSFVVSNLTTPCSTIVVNGSVTDDQDGGSIGAVVIAVTGGTTPYTYLWSTGAKTKNLSNVPAGSYSVVATDANGCTGNNSFNITNIAAACPDINIVGSITNDLDGASIGAISIVVSGGLAPYSYQWSNGTTNKNLSGIESGNYSVTATDANGCTGNKSFIIINKITTTTNTVPTLKLNYETSAYKGLVYTLDASNSFDADNDPIYFNWNVPADLSVSSKTSPVISFLPSVDSDYKLYTIGVSVTDGKDTVFNNISIGINDFNPDAYELKIATMQASGFVDDNYPEYIIDNDNNTSWVAEGDDQWIVFELAEESFISYFELSFVDLKESYSYFDVYATADKVTWDLILDNSISSGFSADKHIFDIPEVKGVNPYKYVRLVGHMNSKNSINNITEFKIYGSPNGTTSNSNISKAMAEVVEVYPNPASDDVFVKSTAGSTIRVVDLSGNVVYEQFSSSDILKLDYQFQTGIYFVQIMDKQDVSYTRKLIVK